MAPRANWKGHLRLGALSCGIALYSAASASERVAFHTLNRATGHRVRREFLDEVSGAVVPSEQQVKGYDLGDERYVLLEPEELAKAVPKATKVLDIASFVPADAMDLVFLDTPYFLAPADAAAAGVFALLRSAMAREGVAGLARTVIFRRERLFLLQPYGQGLLGFTLHFDYEIRAAGRAYDKVPKLKIPAEMRDLAGHIIATKRGSFDAAAFDDRYDAALLKVIRAKQAGRKIKHQAPPAAGGKVVNLLDALRRSAGSSATKAKPTKRKASAKASRPAPRRKAG